MATKEYKQMIQRGKWLEKFLTPELKSWDYKKLAMEFIDIYDVEYEFWKDEPWECYEDNHPNPDDIAGADNVDFDAVPYAKVYIKMCFEAIQCQDRPWEYIFSKEGQPVPYTVEWLCFSYNLMGDKIIVGEDSLMVKKCIGFPITDVTITEGFPWKVAVSRMFFDFLFLGGQEYFLFCKQCGNFAVIERKGRKIFCSDVCKTRFRTANLP